nr:phosphatase PAP2 family protein [uncultured Sphingomonas sp.]
MPRLPLIALVLLVAGFAWSMAFPGPLPGDVTLTLTVQRLLGDDPAWARWLTQSAKFPMAWALLGIAAALTWIVRGWRGALAAGFAFALAHGLDKLLRLLVSTPRPSADLVAVAAPASSSGLPSTFGLVYGALFGLTTIAALGQRRPAARAILLLSAALLASGFLARVVLGGHWPSQMLLSLLLGALAGGTMLGLANRTGGKQRKRN